MKIDKNDNNFKNCHRVICIGVTISTAFVLLKHSLAKSFGIFLANKGI